VPVVHQCVRSCTLKWKYLSRLPISGTCVIRVKSHTNDVRVLEACMHCTVKATTLLNKNLAIANRSRISFAHSTSRAASNNPVTLKFRLRVTQGHRKWRCSIEHV